MPTPIVVGVGDFKNATKEVSQAIEPMQLMLNAIGIAINDTGLSEAAAAKLQSEIDSISIVRTWTWPYPNLPELLSEKLGVNPSYKHYSDHGGNQPGVIFDDAARRVSKGESKVAVVTGGEALASRKSYLFIFIIDSLLLNSKCLCCSEEDATTWMVTARESSRRSLLPHYTRTTAEYVQPCSSRWHESYFEPLSQRSWWNTWYWRSNTSLSTF